GALTYGRCFKGIHGERYMARKWNPNLLGFVSDGQVKLPRQARIGLDEVNPSCLHLANQFSSFIRSCHNVSRGTWKSVGDAGRLGANWSVDEGADGSDSRSQQGSLRLQSSPFANLFHVRRLGPHFPDTRYAVGYEEREVPRVGWSAANLVEDVNVHVPQARHQELIPSIDDLRRLRHVHLG